MIGIIPSASSTYEVFGDFNSDQLIEGKIYYHPDTFRLYYYSHSLRRSNPDTGYFPIWDGKKTYESKFSNEKYFSDVITNDIKSLSKTISRKKAKDIIYKQRVAVNDKKIYLVINDEDNMFTQCIKSSLNKMDISIIDLFDMNDGLLTEKQVENYYSSLSKVTMMRMEKFHVWLSSILHFHYDITVYKGDKKLLKYSWPKDKFNTGMVKYNYVYKPGDDPYKKIVKVLMVIENISKSSLKMEDVNDYTINNMMTTLNGTKSLSAQIFCRFIRMTDLSFTLELFNNKNELVFMYQE